MRKRKHVEQEENLADSDPEDEREDGERTPRRLVSLGRGRKREEGRDGGGGGWGGRALISLSIIPGGGGG